MKKIFLIILIMLITGCENNDTTEENLLNDLIKINKKLNYKMQQKILVLFVMNLMKIL